MMKRIALIENSVVINVIVADELNLPGLIQSDIEMVELDDSSLVAAGYAYQNMKFIPPNANELTSPVTITLRQLRLALINENQYDYIKSLILKNQGNDAEKLRVEWEYAINLTITHPLVSFIFKYLKLTDQKASAWFTKTSAI